MTIYDIIDNILAGVCEYYWHAMPEFAEGEEPEKYAVYSVRGLPRNFASGRSSAAEYFISVSLFTPTVDEPLKDRAISEFEKLGGIFVGENEQPESAYPKRKHKILDFLFYQDKEEQ